MSEEFKPGQKVPRSGIYCTTHGRNEHALAHDVTCIFGTTFPPCRQCGDQVRFTLIKYAKDVGGHEHFRT